jgi:thiol:disulfide interchange protein DsbD
MWFPWSCLREASRGRANGLGRGVHHGRGPGLVAEAPCSRVCGRARRRGKAGAVLGSYPFAFRRLTALLAVVGLVSGATTALPTPGIWTVRVKRAGGLLLIAMAEYYLVRMGGSL